MQLIFFNVPQKLVFLTFGSTTSNPVLSKYLNWILIIDTWKKIGKKLKKNY